MNNNDSFIQKFLSVINNSNKVLVAAHPSADMDSIGSTLAMYEICKILTNNNVSVVPLVWEKSDLMNYSLDDMSDLIVYDIKYFNIKEFDVVILLDIGDMQRLPIYKDIINSNIKIVVIDHHINSCAKQKGRIDLMLNYVCRSTTKMLYNEFVLSKVVKMNKRLANQILFGLYGDTEYFTDTGIRPDDLRLIADLIEAGADLDNLIVFTHRSKSINKLKLYARLLNFVQIDQKFAFCILSYNDIQLIYSEFGIKPDKHDILDTLRSIEGVDFGIAIFEPTPNFLTASLKSRTNKYNLEKFASHFGGGGHAISAAFRFNTDNFERDVEKILTFLRSETSTS